MTRKRELRFDKSFEKALASVKKMKKNSVYGTRRRPDDENIDTLKKMFPKGSTVFLILRKRSASGLSREIGVVSMQPEGKQIVDLHPNYAVAELLGLKINKEGNGIKIGGAGMDMGFHLVSNLSRALYGDDYAIKHRWL